MSFVCGRAGFRSFGSLESGLPSVNVRNPLHRTLEDHTLPLMLGFKSGAVDANSVKFGYVESGEGPLVLCLHGFPDNALTYRYLLPKLAGAGFRAVAAYMRGYAPTAIPDDGRYQAAALGQDALELIRALGSASAFVIGHDWGALAGYSAATLGPEKVSRLVTLGAAHPGASLDRDFDYLRGTWHSYYFQLPSAETTLPHNDFQFIADWWKNASPNWDIPAELLESVKETFRQPGVVKAALDYYRHAVNSDLRDPALEETETRLVTGRISVPTLALHGTHDRPKRLESFEQMDRLFSGPLTKVVLPGTGHFLHLEEPEETARLVLDFLSP